MRGIPTQIFVLAISPHATVRARSQVLKCVLAEEEGTRSKNRSVDLYLYVQRSAKIKRLDYFFEASR